MLYIKELLPNPAGVDKGNEWIRIINDDPNKKTPNGWYIKDEGGATYDLTDVGVIAGGEIVELGHTLTGINLNNSGDTVSLYDDTDSLIDELSYRGGLVEGEIVVADRFLEEINRPTGEHSLLAGVFEDGIISYSPGVLALLGALVVALGAALLGGIVYRYIFDTDD